MIKGVNCRDSININVIWNVRSLLKLNGNYEKQVLYIR